MLDLIKYIFLDFKNGVYKQKKINNYGVYGVVGLYGSGKSEYLAYLANYYKSRGSLIYANFALSDSINFDDFSYIYNLCVKNIKTHKIIIIDECQMYAPEGTHINYYLRLLLTQCRKLNVLIFWSSQDYSRVNKNIRLMSLRIYQISSKFAGRLLFIKDFNSYHYELYYNALTNKNKYRIYRPKFVTISDDIRHLYNTYELIAPDT